MTQQTFSFIGSLEPEQPFNNYEINIDFNGWTLLDNSRIIVNKILIAFLKSPYIKTETKIINCPPSTIEVPVYGSPKVRELDLTDEKLSKINYDTIQEITNINGVYQITGAATNNDYDRYLIAIYFTEIVPIEKGSFCMFSRVENNTLKLYPSYYIDRKYYEHPDARI